MALASSMTAFAEVGEVVTDLTQLSNTKCYTITPRGNDRGTWYYNAADASHLYSTVNAGGATVDATDPAQQFAFIKSESGHYYVYNVGAKKFLQYSNYSEGGATFCLLVDKIMNSDSYTTLVSSTENENNKNYPWVVALGEGNHHIGISNGYKYGVITSYQSTNDDGNCISITEAGEFDATEALAKIKEFESLYTPENIATANTLNAEVNKYLSVPQYAIGGYDPQAWAELNEACGGDGIVDIYDVPNAENIKAKVSALVNKGFVSVPSKPFSNDKVYMIYNKVSSNGYIYAKEGDNRVFSSSKNSSLATVPNSDKWQLHEEDGKYYLYNQGTKTYAAYNGKANGNDAWAFTLMPTVVNVVQNAENPAVFTIQDAAYTGNTQYMHINNSYANGVVGWGTGADATKFYIEEVPDAEAVALSDLASTRAQMQEQLASLKTSVDRYLNVPQYAVGGCDPDLWSELNDACGGDGLDAFDLSNAEEIETISTKIEASQPTTLSNEKVYKLQGYASGSGYLCFEKESNENSNYVYSSTKIANQKLTQLENSANWQIYTFGDKAILYNQGKQSFVKYDQDNNKWVATDEPVYIDFKNFSTAVFGIQDMETTSGNSYININNGNNSFPTGVLGYICDQTTTGSHFYVIEVPGAEAMNLDAVAGVVLSRLKEEANFVLDSYVYDESKVNYVGSYSEEALSTLQKVYEDPNATASDVEEALNSRKQVEAGKYYTILNTMQFTDGGVKAIYANPDGTNVAWHTTEGTAAELWQFVQENGGDGDYYIKNVNSGKSIVLNPGADSGNLQETSNTPFRFSEQGDDFITFGLQAWNNQNSDKATLALQTEASWGKIPDAETESGDFIGTNNNINATTPSTWNIVEVTSVNLTIGSTGYATAYFPFAVTIPEGVKAYTVSAAADGVATLSPLTGTIPANTGVILSGEVETAYPFAITTSEVSKVEGNLLDGVTMATNIPETSYILANKNGNLGFYKVDPSDTKLAANKAYLVVNGAQQSLYRLNLDGAVTGIQSVENAAENAPAYDLQGRRLPQVPTKGLYIQNGKKIMK